MAPVRPTLYCHQAAALLTARANDAAPLRRRGTNFARCRGLDLAPRVAHSKASRLCCAVSARRAARAPALGAVLCARGARGVRLHPVVPSAILALVWTPSGLRRRLGESAGNYPGVCTTLIQCRQHPIAGHYPSASKWLTSSCCPPRPPRSASPPPTRPRPATCALLATPPVGLLASRAIICREIRSRS